jgi:tetratricopeptide (TPR) repeat protein
LERLDRALDNGTATTMLISAVGGAGGIGKTWLVLHWAHDHLERFPDGQLHVDLRGFSPDSEPMRPSVAVRGFLAALGVEQAGIPVDEHAQAALYRSLVATRRMLIVLDNAASTEQVVPLLPGSAMCTVVITTRQYLPGLVSAHCSRHLALDVLPVAEARALLSQRIGAVRVARESEAADALIAACGGFPLALSVIAGRVAAHPDLPLSAVMTELRETGLDGLDDGDPAASMPLVLSWSYRALTAEQRRLFALLGIAPGPDISLSATVSLGGIPEAQARILLRGLEHASLLVPYTAGRYRMHDLIRACAQRHAEADLEPAGRQSALRRLVDFYLHTAHNGHLVLEPHNTPITLSPPSAGCVPRRLTGHADALIWFTEEHLCLLAVQSAAAELGTWQLAWALTAFHSLGGFLHDNLRAWCGATEALGECPDPATDTLVHRYLGNAYLRVGQPDVAREHLRHALSTAELVGDHDGQARVHRIISVLWEQQENNEQALTHATRALELFRAAGNSIWEADTLVTVAWCEALLGRFDHARLHCQTAYLALRYQHLPGAADALDTLGYITHRTGRHAEALDYFHQALALYRELGDLFHTPDTLNRAGHVLVALGEPGQARAAWQEALQLYRRQQRTADIKRIEQQLATPLSGMAGYTWPYRRR